MQLPTWIPKVPRPWNPAYQEVWDVMTDNEKRASFLVDVAIVALVLFLVWSFQ